MHFCLFLFVFACGSANVKPVEVDKISAVVYLVRHGEKVDNSADAMLSDEGYVRARELAEVLKDAQIETIHSSAFTRTRQTAAPCAVLFGSEPEVYDVGKLTEIAEKIKFAGGTHLVVGHSTTTCELVNLLGGSGGSKIDENEFDRLYVVTIYEGGSVETDLRRYGEPFVAED